jgi:hypothetical protein
MQTETSRANIGEVADTRGQAAMSALHPMILKSDCARKLKVEIPSPPSARLLRSVFLMHPLSFRL